MSGSGQPSALDSYVAGLRFKKIGSGPLMLPGVFAPLAALGLAALAHLTFSLAANGGVDPGLAALSRLSIAAAGLVLSSAFASYLLLKAVSLHFYDSAVAVYYMTRKEGFENVVNYIRERREARSLPSPATGLLMGLLLGPVAYAAVLAVVEKSLREHARAEEAMLLGREFTEPYRAENVVTDLLLSALTLGAYLAAWARRVASLFNAHVGGVHGSHPLPPQSPGPTPPPAPLHPAAPFAAVLAASLIDSAAALLGAPVAIPHMALVLGASIFAASLGAGWRPGLAAARVFALLYFSLAASMIAGLAGARFYAPLLEQFRSEARAALQLGVGNLALFIFFNNASIAASSIVPALGPFVLGEGAANAGIILGAAAAGELARAVHVLAMPHTPLELAGYSMFAAASQLLLSDQAKAARYALLGVLTLLAAAFVEARLVSP